MPIPPDYFDSSSTNLNYTNRDLIEDEMSEMGVEYRLDDDDNGYVTSTSSGGVTTGGEELRLRRLISWSTGYLNSFLTKRYDVSELQKSWVVCYWATIASCWRLCKRRMNPNPFQSEWEGIMKQLLDVQNGRMDLSEIGERYSSAPGVDNFRVDPRYHTKMLRVESSISDRTPNQHTQNTDWVDRMIPEQP